MKKQKPSIVTAMIQIAEKIGEQSALLRRLTDGWSESPSSAGGVSDSDIEQFFSKKEAQIAKQKQLAQELKNAEIETGRIDWSIFDGVKSVVFIKQNNKPISNPVLTMGRALQYRENEKVAVLAITKTGLVPIWTGIYNYRIDIKKRLPPELANNDMLVMLYGERPESGSGYTD